MTVSEFITALEMFKARYGDLSVEHEGPMGRRAHPGPVLRHAKILRRRESREAFWRFDADMKGEPLCRL